MDPGFAQDYVSYRNFSYRPLFAVGGPSAGDVVQGAVGDCWFLASLASVAKADPQEIRQRIADLGDGTYIVQFKSAGKDVHVRVDADLPSYSTSSLAYAGFGAGGSIWAAIMEKAYAMFRKGEASYASLESGWMSEAFGDLGFTSSTSYETTQLLADRGSDTQRKSGDVRDGGCPRWHTADELSRVLGRAGDRGELRGQLDRAAQYVGGGRCWQRWER